MNQAVAMKAAVRSLQPIQQFLFGADINPQFSHTLSAYVDRDTDRSRQRLIINSPVPMDSDVVTTGTVLVVGATVDRKRSRETRV